MKPIFISLTDTKGGETYYVNTGNILWMAPDKVSKGTNIMFAEKYGITVKENAQEIVELIRTES